MTKIDNTRAKHTQIGATCCQLPIICCFGRYLNLYLFWK